MHLHLGQELVSEEAKPHLAERTVSLVHMHGGSRTPLSPPDQALPAVEDLALDEAGGHLIALERNAAWIELDAEAFHAYLEHEGLDAIARAREAAGEQDTPGRERYTRYLKAWIPVGAVLDDTHARVVGHELELRLLEMGRPRSEVRVARMNRVDESVLDHVIHHQIQSNARSTAALRWPSGTEVAGFTLLETNLAVVRTTCAWFQPPRSCYGKGMSAHPADTTPEAWTVQTSVWRRMGPVRRLKTALKLSEDIRAVSAAGIQRRHPEYSVEQVRWALLRRQFGDELFGRVYPEAPLLEP